jgi:hypothetical protein
MFQDEQFSVLKPKNLRQAWKVPDKSGCVDYPEYIADTHGIFNVVNSVL